MPLRHHFQQLVDRHGPEVLLRPDIDQLLAAEGAFDALPALRYITRAAAASGVLGAIARQTDDDAARAQADRFATRTGFRHDMVASVLEAALEALGKPAWVASSLSPAPYTPGLDRREAIAAEPLASYESLADDITPGEGDIRANIERAIEIRHDNEARRGARIANPACVLADRDSMTLTFELRRLNQGRGTVAVARYAVYDTAGRVADTDFAGDITPGDTNPLPVKCTIPVSPANASRIILFLD